MSFTPCTRCAEHVAELQEELVWLRSELGAQVSSVTIDTIARGLGLTQGQASIVAALHNAKGRPVSKLQLLEAMPSPSGNEDRVLKVVEVQVCLLRKRLGESAVLTTWGRGFRISDDLRARVADILAPQAEGAAARTVSPAPSPSKPSVTAPTSPASSQ